jgi:hypothetical protein
MPTSRVASGAPRGTIRASVLWCRASDSCWTEHDPKRWRCLTCQPPDHLPAEAICREGEPDGVASLTRLRRGMPIRCSRRRGWICTARANTELDDCLGHTILSLRQVERRCPTRSRHLSSYQHTWANVGIRVTARRPGTTAMGANQNGWSWPLAERPVCSAQRQ